MAQIVVQKFGGTTLATADLRKIAAARVIDCQSSGSLPVVVVSAIGRFGSPYATDTLLAFASENAELSGRCHDLIASCGETISAVIFSQLLKSLKVEAVPLTGAQAGILTDRVFSKARVTAIDCERIYTHVQAGQIPVIAGYQGYADNGDVTTLGRGGSDTTACVLGAALHATRVEIYTDVEGLMTA
ncbi:MAG: aspartate kinase, partial [Gammaproteobacteria bacterium]|nr:aspartate kinase [Gammaproteobacteria bacterium]